MSTTAPHIESNHRKNTGDPIITKKKKNIRSSRLGKVLRTYSHQNIIYREINRILNIFFLLFKLIVRFLFIKFHCLIKSNVYVLFMSVILVIESIVMNLL